VNRRRKKPGATSAKKINFTIEVSLLFILSAAAFCILFPFSLGFYVKQSILAANNEKSENVDILGSEEGNLAFPHPLLLDGKEVPHTIYSSKHWQSGSSASRASLYIKKNGDNEMGNTCQESFDGETQCTFAGSEEVISSAQEILLDDDEEDDDEDEDEHLPAGQHLLVDIKNVDEYFLNSETRLAKAMVDVASESKLTLLSYHCHTLIPAGVSCVGVLLESHVSLHTWPKEGVITIDLFTCGSGLLVPVLPIIERLFAVPRSSVDPEAEEDSPLVRWSHFLRGFTPQEKQGFLSKDLGESVMFSSERKREVATAQTEFQRIDIYDFFIDHEAYMADRTIFLDGVMQSTSFGSEAYHEALVHPGMFSHGDPKRVAIIGGGECATLREVLKHNTVEHVKMIEIDEEMVQVSREHLPDWNTCSDIKGSAVWCGDDTRADIHYGDALAWFIDNFSDNVDEYKEEQFDVLFMDALDPQDDVPFAEVLYTHTVFFKALYNSLSDNGIMVLQLGESPNSDEPPDEFTKSSRRAYLTNSLGDVGFQAIHVFEEGHCGFGDSWSYLIAMKNKESNLLWYNNAAQINLSIHERTLRTHSGTSALKYFDGTTMESYQIPAKGFESNYCNQYEISEDCHTLATKEDIPVESLEVRMSGAGDNSGQGVFTTVDIKEGSRIAKKATSQYVHIPPSTFERMNELLESLSEVAGSISDVMHYLEGYGRQTEEQGKEGYFVDSSILTFVNHGCFGTFNVDDQSRDLDLRHVTEQNFELSNASSERNVYDPFHERHLLQNMNNPRISLRDIKKGEELLENYLRFAEREEDVRELKRICDNVSAGITPSN